MKTYRAAVIGATGRGDYGHAVDVAFTKVPGVEVVAIADAHGAGRAAAQKRVAAPTAYAVTKADVAEGNEGIGLLAGDNVQARFRFPGGIYGHFASRQGMGANPARFGVQVFGSRGILEMYSGYLEPAYILQDGSWSPGRTGKSWQKKLRQQVSASRNLAKTAITKVATSLRSKI